MQIITDKQRKTTVTDILVYITGKQLPLFAIACDYAVQRQTVVTASLSFIFFMQFCQRT